MAAGGGAIATDERVPTWKSDDDLEFARMTFKLKQDVFGLAMWSSSAMN